jgi:hypothetical protein
MGPSRSEQAAVSRRSYLPTQEFEQALGKHKGKSIDLGVGPGGSNVPAVLLEVGEGRVSFSLEDGRSQTVSILKVKGYTAGEEYARHKTRS